MAEGSLPMRAAAAIAVLMLMAAGCRNHQVNSMDPFLGKTTVPAPATGTIAPTYAPTVTVPNTGVAPNNNMPQPAPYPANQVSPNGQTTGTTGWQTSGTSADPQRTTVNSGAGATAADTRTAPGFGHGRDYTWLKGKLEHSADGQWRLHYSDNASQPDSYGGVVVLPDTVMGSQYANGDFVAVQGRMDATAVADARGNPYFDVERIKPLR
jgi:hypothetical protein